MNKKEVQQRVLQNGKPLDLDKFEWDEEARVFSTTEGTLVLDFAGIDGVTFDTGWYCTFNTGPDCTFNTGEECVVVRRDIYEVIELEEGKPIKLNGYGIKGFTYINSHKITIDGAEIASGNKEKSLEYNG